MYTHRPSLWKEVLSDSFFAVQETPAPTPYTQAWHIQATSLRSPGRKGDANKTCQIPHVTPQHVSKEIRKNFFLKKFAIQVKFEKVCAWIFFYLREVNESNRLLWEQGL